MNAIKTKSTRVKELEKTLRYEVLQEVCKMTNEELQNKIDELIGQITTPVTNGGITDYVINSELNDMDREVLMARAMICSEFYTRRLQPRSNSD
jgi:hypothetical protein